MARKPRTFELEQARREAVPVSFGIMGPSGSGKTYSALRIATGIVSVTGGEICLVDTENKRGLFYADRFNYRRLELQPPFSALDYKDAIEAAANAVGPTGVVIVDSMSHEHEGEGGLLWQAETFLERQPENRREKMRLASFNKPKRERTVLINFIERLPCSIVLCFRAKEKVRPVRGSDGKMQIQDFGWEPIGGDDFAYSMLAMCMLQPNGGGVPQWRGTRPGEALIVKRPEMFKHVLTDDNKPLSEAVGAALAQWSVGEKSDPPAEPGDPPLDGMTPAAILEHAKKVAREGEDRFSQYWSEAPESVREVLRDHGTELRDIIDEASQ